MTVESRIFSVAEYVQSMNAQRITRQFKNVPLKTVLAEVEKELQYSITYKKDEVNERKQITRDFKDASLEEELKSLLGVDVDLLTPGDLPPKFRAKVLAEAQPI